MRYEGRVAFVAASIVFLSIGGARSEVVGRYDMGQWVVEANASNGRFEYCASSGKYSRGAAVHFLLTREAAWGMVIENPNWNWVRDSRGDVTYWVDNYRSRASGAKATAPTRLLIPLADSTQLFQEIRAGRVLYFQPRGNKPFSVTLNGTSSALSTLMKCVARYR
ncbi:hypothetical protein FZC33_27450 [Labrys sp. KNU-23]|uniref:hypothetical protein n=1 Tax=Labrys sp. KNU-23 TaxID=2789216 RepID=UPI0011F01F90|nr:hypothetical protein [Labrys sp. KNU-23]QEN89819.1 hypothetical protein FZC33_27450 [Labrys sp. KNU-23]